MTPQRWKDVKDLFHRALERAPADRDAFLAKACAKDHALRREIESLIASHELSGDFIDSPAYEGAAELIADPKPQFEPGRMFGAYRIISFIGRGGMGEIYLAEDTRLSRSVALKFLSSGFVNDADRLRRFEQEARAGSALNHPNILTIHEISQLGDRNFIATEFIEGNTLRQRLAAGPMPINEALGIAEQIASALSEAHAKGILHRDIKPENVMLRSDGIVKVLDFGVAKLIEQAVSEPEAGLTLTRTGMILGTVSYMSPEQARGLTVDARTDIWSVGVVLYEMLTGRPPFTGLTASDVMASVLERELQPLGDQLPGAPAGLKKIVQKMLRKSREERYQTMAEVQSDLKKLQHELENPVAEPAETKAIAFSTNRWWATHPKLKWLAAGVLVVLVFGIVVGLYELSRRFLLRRKPETVTIQPSLLKTVQLTSWNGLDLGPSFSPDGSAIAYSSDHSGSLEIYVKQLAAGGREIQITTDGQQNLQPAWSPDGRVIAYHSRKRGGVWLVPALGGVARQLTEFGSYPAWSPDGSLIAFQSAGIGEGVLSISSGAISASTIWIAPSGGGAPKQISQPSSSPGNHGSPTWSPDGKTIAFTSFDLSRQPEIWLVNADGSQPRFVRNGIEPVYMPDGKSICFIGNPLNSSYGIWQIPVSPSPSSTNVEPVKVMDAGAATIKRLSITPDGKRLAYTALMQTSNLWSLALTPSFEPAAPPTALTRELNYRTSGPAVSPDGEKIAYTVNRAGGQPAGLWIINANGTNPTQISNESVVGPTWSQDGEHILYVTRREGRAVLWSIPRGGGKERQVLDLDQGASFLRVSPDGKQVAFNLTDHGVMNLWLAQISGGAPTQLTFDRESMGFANWSPDGRFIALGVKRGDDHYIGVVPSSGGEVRQLKLDRGISSPGSWSPDGSKIVFSGARNGVWNVYWISPTTNEQHQLTKYTGMNTLIRYPVWSPKGNQIVYEFGETTANVWMLELK